MQLDLFDAHLGERIIEESDDKYTSKIDGLIYEPSAKCPHVLELANTTKLDRLLNDIQNSKISDDDKRFLSLAAYRHVVFNYSKIADYYSHASKDVQELMEQSALVIVDFESAIENGYVKLSENIRKIQEATGRKAKEEYKNQWRDTIS